jgi:hypothetical protein
MHRHTARANDGKSKVRVAVEHVFAIYRLRGRTDRAILAS